MILWQTPCYRVPVWNILMFALLHTNNKSAGNYLGTYNNNLLCSSKPIFLLGPAWSTMANVRTQYRVSKDFCRMNQHLRFCHPSKCLGRCSHGYGVFPSSIVDTEYRQWFDLLPPSIQYLCPLYNNLKWEFVYSHFVKLSFPRYHMVQLAQTTQLIFVRIYTTA